MSQETTLDFKINTRLFKPPNIGEVDSEVSREFLTRLKYGNLADQANTVFFDRKTLTTSQTFEYDLAGGILDAFGNTITFTTVKTIILFSDRSNQDLITAQSKASNGWVAPWGGTGKGNRIPPGGLFYLSNPDLTGMAVVAATGDLLEVKNDSATFTAQYDLILIGVE